MDLIWTKALLNAVEASFLIIYNFIAKLQFAKLQTDHLVL